MPLTPQDFTTEGLSVGDFGEVPPRGISLNKNTVATSTATVALLAGQNKDQYNTLVTDAMNPDTRESALRVMREQRGWLQEDAMYASGAVLADEEGDEMLKSFVTDRIVNQDWDQMEMGKRSIDTLAEEALISTSSLDETERAAQARANALDIVIKGNDHKIRMQKVINDVKAQHESGILGKIVDVADLFVPFAEWLHFDRLQKDLLGKDEYQVELLGQQKQRIFEHFDQMDMSEKEQILETVIQTLEDSDQIVLPDGNDLVLIDTLQKIAGLDDYSTTEKWFDSLTSVLDIVGVGALVRGATKARKATQVSDAIDWEDAAHTPFPDAKKGYEAGKSTAVAVRKNMEMDLRDGMAALTRSDVNPTAPSQILKETNPEQARSVHAAVAADETGEVAMSTYGTTREDALSKDRLPEVEAGSTKGIPNKVEMADEDEFIKVARTERGSIEISDEGIKRIVGKVEADFKNVEGMNLRKNSLLVRQAESGAIKVTGLYTPVDSGFTTAQEALESAEVAFRHYGVRPDEFTLMKREGDSWKEATEVTDKGEYGVALDFDYGISAKDIDIPDIMVTGGGFLTRAAQFADSALGNIPARLGQGSILQNILDPHSVLATQFVNGASVAVDKSYGLKKLYVDLFGDFSKKYGGLSKTRRAVMRDYIQEANTKGIKFDEGNLYSRGFNESEVEALKVWRKANDTMWYAANDDMVANLINKGYVSVVDRTNDTRLVGKPMKRGAVGANTQYYDPTNNTLGRMKKSTLDTFYEQGGELIRLEDPITIGGKEVDHIISYNLPGKTFTKTLREGDKVLNYRDGYYPVMYDANYFIYKEVMIDGVPRQRVVASAKTSKERDEYIKKLQQTHVADGGKSPDKYGWRKDRRDESARGLLGDDSAWSLAQNSGATYQRVRGKPLEDASANLEQMGKQHLVDPLEAVARQIQGLTNRIAFRPYLDNVKTNWMKYYGDKLELPVNKFTGEVEFPASVADIKRKGAISEDVVNDAKAYHDYISSLENGFINAIDEAWRGSMMYAAEKYGALLGGTAEKLLFSASKLSPTHTAKTVAFKLFLSANPARQAIIQRTQMLLLPVANPTYMATKFVPDMLAMERARLGLKVDPEVAKVYKELKSAGILEAVDSNNLIRSDLLKLAETSNLGKMKAAAGKPLEVSQKVGFDWAEQDVLISAYLTFRDKAVAAGKNLNSKRVRDEVLGEARAFTLNMNRSGEMPYSQNTFALLAQFFQFQHKALLQPLTNKSLSLKQRMALLAYSTAIFGVEASVATNIVNKMVGGDGDPSEMKDAARDGLLDLMLNKSLELASGEEQAVDFGDLSPSSAYGMGNVFNGILETGLGAILTSSPSYSLVGGSNPKIKDFMKTTARYFYPPADYDEELLNTKPSDVFLAAANLFSGFSSSFKARYAFHTGKAMSSSGRITDEDVTKVEAVMLSFGFQTKHQAGNQRLQEELYGGSGKGWEDADFEVWYKELKRHLGRRQQSVSERELGQAVLREAWAVFGEERPRAIEMLNKQMLKDAQSGEIPIYKQIMSLVGIKTPEEVWNLVQQMPAGEARDAMVSSYKKLYGEN